MYLAFHLLGQQGAPDILSAKVCHNELVNG